MKPVIVVTTTFYKSTDELRFRLACDMVGAAVADGHKVVIVDGSPIPQVAETLRGLGAQVFPQLHKGMGPGRREAFFHSYEIAIQDKIEVILWTEPEKVDLVRWIGKITQPINNRHAPIVIPKRSEKAWETWPAFQRQSEQRANRVYKESFNFDEDLDPMFGPVAFHISRAVDFMMCHMGNAGDEIPDTYIQHYAPLIAHHTGSHIASVEIDMVYPPEQRAEEEGSANEAMLAKRKIQLETLTTAYRAIAKSLKK